MKNVAAVVSSILVLVFGYTASSKLLAIGSFRAVLLQAPVLHRGAAALSVLLPLAELGIVLLLLFPATRLKGLWASLGALFLFTVYLGCMLLFAPHLPCSCGGVVGALRWEGHVGMNAGLVCATAVAIRGCRKMSDE